MNSESIMTVSATVVVLTQFVKWAGIPPRFAPWVVALLSAVGVGFWVFASGSIGRADAFGIFAAWVTITASSAGVYGFVRASADSFKGMG